MPSHVVPAEHNRYIMKNTKNIYLHSLVVIPFLAATMGLSGGVPVSDPSTLILDITNKVSNVAPKELTPEEKARIEKAAKIDAYFAENDMPLEGKGMKFVLEAEKNDINPFLLPAISVRESTGGRHACKKVPNQVFGWGGCKIGFESIDVGIEKVTAHIAGNMDSTDHWYDGKTERQILRTYNSVIKYYPDQVLKIMDDMAKIDVSTTSKTIALNS